MLRKRSEPLKRVGILLLAGSLTFGFQSCDKFPYTNPGDNDPKDPDESPEPMNSQCQGTNVSFTSIQKGRQSRITKADNQVVKTALAYSRLWNKLGINAKQPSVDFNKQFVIAVFQGKKPNGGFKINVNGLCLSGQELTASVTKTQPKEGCPVQSAITHPFHLVKVNRSAINGNLNQLQVNFNSHVEKDCIKGTAQGSSGSVNFSTLEKGGMASGIQKQQNKVIRSQSRLKQVWQTIHNGQTNAPAVPKVDFQQKMVVGVFYGEKPSGGYEVTVQNALKQGNQLNVKADLRYPKKGCPVTTVITSPYHLVTVPVTTQNVDFNLSKVARNCR